MSVPGHFDGESAQRGTSGLLDVLIRAGLILALAMLCYQVFAPFLTLMVWAPIPAVALLMNWVTARNEAQVPGRGHERPT